MCEALKILAINPGSTTTKIALFCGDRKIYSKEVSHDAKILDTFGEIKDQLGYRQDTIVNELEKANISLEEIDGYSARGGGLLPLSGGVYHVGDRMLEHAKACLTAKHPATLGCQIADEFARQYGKKAFVVNPPDVDEFIDVARITGIKGVYRESRIHALNQKEIGIRYAESQGKTYEEMCMIIAHIGGGISVTAHEKGRMIDSNDIVNGDGPMAPTRCGSMPVKNIVEMCYSGTYTEKQMLDKTTKSGGLIDHLGTADVREINKMIEQGNDYAKLIKGAMVYQIIKAIGSMATALNGQVEAIILTGGISHDKSIVKRISESTGFIAPIIDMAGEYEMEALAAGALRVMTGREEAKEYTGESAGIINTLK